MAKMIPKKKSKVLAIILSLLFGSFSFFYTWRDTKLNFLVCVVIVFFAAFFSKDLGSNILGLIYFGVGLYPFLFYVFKDNTWYETYGQRHNLYDVIPDEKDVVLDTN